MKIRMLTRAAGPSGVWEPGQVVDVDDTAARDLIERGFAELARKKVRETATKETPEKAVSPSGTRKRQSRRKKAGT
jgi:hypothetical protein